MGPVLGEEEVKNLVDLCAGKDPEFLSDADSEFWESGLLGKEALRSIVATHLVRMPSYKKASIFRTVREHLDEDGIRKFTTHMRREFADEYFYMLSSIDDYKGILDEEELKKKGRLLLLESTNSLNISNNLERVQRFLTPEEFQTWLRDVLFSKNTHINFDDAVQEEIMKSDWLTEEEKQAFRQKLLDEDPRSVFQAPHVFLKNQTKEEQGKTLLGLAEEVSTR